MYSTEAITNPFVRPGGYEHHPREADPPQGYEFRHWNVVLKPGGTHRETSDAFLISDYSVKAVKGAQYDVLYRDLKEEEVVGKDELLEELADC